MKTKCTKNSTSIKQGTLILALCGSLAVLAACSSSSDDGDGGVVAGEPGAYNFNAGNAVNAAEIAAAATSFFSIYTKIAHVVLETLTTGDPANSPFTDIIPCIPGSSTLTWLDNGDGVLSAGDSASLQFSACDLDGNGETVTGTIDIVASSLVENPPAYQLEYTVTGSLTIVLGTDTTTVAAKFKASVDTPDDGFSFTYLYTAADTTGQTLTITENGIEYFKMGCFNVTMAFDTAALFSSNIYTLAPSGPINAASKIMSFAGGPALSFIDDVPESGTKRLLSLAVPECAAIGVATGVADSDGSYMDLEIQGGGLIRLRIYDVNDTEVDAIPTTWDALTN